MWRHREERNNLCLPYAYRQDEQKAKRIHMEMGLCMQKRGGL